MGTDIHYIVQRKQDNKWIDVETAKYDFKTNKDVGGEFKYGRDRNYYWFAWLADVRNGYGFAGIKTFDPVAPLTSDRGFPEDFEYVEPEWDDEGDQIDGHDLGDHSQGYATFAEILAHPRPRRTQYGVLDVPAYRALRAGIMPTSWSGDIAGPGVVVVEEDEFATRSDATHVRTSWDAPDGLDDFIAAVKELATKYGGENVRMIFGFDS